MTQRSNDPVALPVPGKLKGVLPPARGAEGGPPDIGAVLDGRYRLLELIAEGGMGSVYRGERLGLARPVAVKFLHAGISSDPQFVSRFNVEARAMSRLTHPNCVSVIDFGLDRVPYLVMDLVEGTPLRTLLEEGPLPLRRALSIARQILAGLAHAHGHEIVHRDIKPENILVAQTVGFDDHVRILDFGLAKLMDSKAQLTAGMAVGTPSYMAPEQMTEGGVDERVDVYGTGLVLYEMLTGHKAFDALTTAEILLKQQRRPPPAFREVAPAIALPAALEAIVRRALEKAPGDRFPSALAMREALDACERAAVPEREATVFEPSPWGAEGPPVRRPGLLEVARRRLRPGAIIAAVAAAVVLVVLATRPRPPAPPVARPATPVARSAPSVARPAPAVAAPAKLASAPQEKDEVRLLFERHRYREGISAYRAAIKNDPGRRSDPEWIGLVIDSLASPRFASQAEDFLREIGAPAKPLVKEAARAHRNPTVRDHARDLIRYWDHKPWYRR